MCCQLTHLYLSMWINYILFIVDGDLIPVLSCLRTHLVGDSAKVASVTWERSLWGFLTNLIPHPKPATGNWANKGGLRVWGLDSKEPE